MNEAALMDELNCGRQHDDQLGGSGLVSRALSLSREETSRDQTVCRDINVSIELASTLGGVSA